jgi:hypothetical protein
MVSDALLIFCWVELKSPAVDVIRHHFDDRFYL